MQPSARLIAIAGMAIAAPALSAQSRTANQTIARAVQTYNAPSTVRISFEQTWTNPLTGNTGTSRGELLRKQPNLVAINFTDPKGDRIVADGKVLWIYLPSSTSNQVIKSSSSAGGTLDPISELLSSPTERYTLTDAGSATIGGHATREVTLTPRTSGAIFSKATVWVDDADGTVRQVEATEPSGMQRRVTITKFTPNAAIANSELRFTPPSGARIIDRTR